MTARQYLEVGGLLPAASATASPQSCSYAFAPAALAPSFCGTEAYLAPEMILRLPYGASVDFWQYGCFVYELYAGRSPFWLPRKPRKFIRENILNGVFAYPSVVPDAAKGITGALLQVGVWLYVHFPRLFWCTEYTGLFLSCTCAATLLSCFLSNETATILFLMCQAMLCFRPSQSSWPSSGTSSCSLWAIRADSSF